MMFHENHQLADNSHEISYLIFLGKLGKMSQNLSSAAVVIGALRVNLSFTAEREKCSKFLNIYCNPVRFHWQRVSLLNP